MASGVVEVDIVKKSQRLGAIDFVPKPFAREMLRQALERAVVPPAKTT
jgi:FixJ family two-component response regulator